MSRSPDDQPLDLEAAFRAHAPYVASIGLRLLGRPEDVDDLVQDVFLIAYRGMQALREPSALRGWLAAVAVRVARRRLRVRRIRRVLGLEDDYDYASARHPALSPEEHAMLAAVYRTLDGLPASQRLAWSLRYIEGERLERVAELCRCSLATAKRWIAAAHAVVQEGYRDG